MEREDGRLIKIYNDPCHKRVKGDLAVKARSLTTTTSQSCRLRRRGSTICNSSDKPPRRKERKRLIIKTKCELSARRARMKLRRKGEACCLNS